MTKTREVYLVRFVLLLLVGAMMAPVLGAQEPEALRQRAAQIAGEIVTKDRAYEYVRELTDKFGGRLGGSPAYERSAQWAAEQFRAMGIRDVKLEALTIPNGWERGWARGRILAPQPRQLYVESMGWSPSTPRGGVRGEIAILDDVTPDKLKQSAAQWKGRIALLDFGKISGGNYLDGLFKFTEATKTLQQMGVAAILWPDSANNNVLNAQDGTWGANGHPLPLAQIGKEDAVLIRRWLEKGPVTVEFEFQNKLTGRTETHNVIAEIRGRERSDEWVMLGAHLDSWDYGTGAQDNGTGVAMVMEAARALVASGQAPRRSIRFALWAAEEEGLLGSFAYVRLHREELKKCVAYVNTDSGAGHPQGILVMGREDLQKPVQALLDGGLRGLGAETASLGFHMGSDHLPFFLHGIPAFDLDVDDVPYGLVHHKPSDTLDKVDRHQLTSGAAIVAVMAYLLAERAEPIGPHAERGAIEKILQGNKVDPAMIFGRMKELGLWP